MMTAYQNDKTMNKRVKVKRILNTKISIRSEVFVLNFQK